MTDRISTADFDVSLPHGWQALRSESKPGMVVFQSADGNARLTVSVSARLSRRQAEKMVMPI